MRVILIISSANKVHSLFYSLINIVCWRTVQMSKSLLILVFGDQTTQKDKHKMTVHFMPYLVSGIWELAQTNLLATVTVIRSF